MCGSSSTLAGPTVVRRLLPFGLALALILAACSSVDDPGGVGAASAEAGSAGTPDTAAAGRSGAEGVPEELAWSATPPVTSSAWVFEPGVDEQAVAALGPDGLVPPDDDAPPVDEPLPVPTTQPTSSPAAQPVTTIGGGGGGDPMAIYQGVMGNLEPDQVLVPAVVAPPTLGAGILPLTGEPGTVPNRPAAVVKIDNGSAARPQTGLNQADLVVEEEVEGGLTRFAAVFHSRSFTVGPVRSGRTTDIGVLGSLGTPLLLYSGANQVTDTLLRRQTYVQNRSYATSSGYWRGHGRAPSNLYSDTGPHWASASGGPPPAHFAYRPTGDAVGGSLVSGLTVSYRANRVAWTWDGTAWLRSQGGRAHIVRSGDRVSAANVVVIEAQEVATGMVDSSGASVPEFVSVGTGRAVVYTAGHRIEGIWTRPSLASVATLTTANGDVIELTPGRTWIELVEAGAGMVTDTP
jgi:hypothetical protein